MQNEQGGVLSSWWLAQLFCQPTTSDGLASSCPQVTMPSGTPQRFANGARDKNSGKARSCTHNILCWGNQLSPLRSLLSPIYIYIHIRIVLNRELLVQLSMHLYCGVGFWDLRASKGRGRAVVFPERVCSYDKTCNKIRFLLNPRLYTLKLPNLSLLLLSLVVRTRGAQASLGPKIFHNRVLWLKVMVIFKSWLSGGWFSR